MHGVTIGYFGMTHLGICSAMAAAVKGYNVVCFDQDDQLIQNLQHKQLHVQEPELDALLKKHDSQLTFTASLDDLLKADLIYIAIDVPTDANNQSDVSPIKNALEQLRPQLRDDQVVVVLSQVHPGFMRSMQFSETQLFYQVETLIFGRAIERATQPERFIVGAASKSQALPKVFNDFLSTFNCPILPMRYESAELAKISINMYLVSSVLTSNVLADLASKVGADWQDIIPTLRLDKRIGEYAYLNPGLGIAGGNLERDMVSIVTQADKHGMHAELVKTWLADSRYYRDWVLRCLEDYPVKDARICVLGLAYKPNTHSVKNSQSLHLLEQLSEQTVTCHDPVVEFNHPGVKNTIEDALANATTVIIMTPWDHYQSLTQQFIQQHAPDCQLVIDPYRVITVNQESAPFTYCALGQTPFIKEAQHA